MGRRFTTLTRWLPAVLAAGMTGTALPAQDKKPDTPKSAVAPAKPEKTVTFSFENKPWSQVIDWFKTESGLVYASTYTPTGSVTIKPNAGKKYTIPEVIDLLNEMLAPKSVLIRREQTFTIWPADEPIESQDVARITEDDLAKRGKTEVVQLVVSLGSLNAEETVPQLKVMLSSFGKISPLGGNSVIVQDKAGNVRRIKTEIDNLTEEGKQHDKLAYQCKYVKAASAAETLKTLLAGDGVTVDLANNAAMQLVPGMTTPYGAYPNTQQFDPRQFGGRGGRNFPTPEANAAAGSRFKSVRISVQEQTNTILITGPVDKISAAKKFLSDDIDKGKEQYVIGGDPTFRTYAVPANSAQAIAQTLSTTFKNSSVAVVPVGTDRIMVYGYPADQLFVAKQLSSDSKDGGSLATVTKIIPITSSDAKTVAALMT
jgi:type II secretory pathway component GspD/PulD (secretin)